jgi:hypothetical protein
MQTQDGVLRLWVYAKSKWHKKAQSKQIDWAINE